MTSPLGIVRHRAAAVDCEHLGDLAARAVDHRREDVRRTLAGELHDPLAEVGLDGREPGRLERVVELDLLGDHRLALGDHLDAAAPRDLEHGAQRVVRRRCADDAAAAGRDRLLEAIEELRRACHGGGADGLGAIDALRPVGVAHLDVGAEIQQVAARSLQRRAQAGIAQRRLEAGIECAVVAVDEAHGDQPSRSSSSGSVVVERSGRPSSAATPPRCMRQPTSPETSSARPPRARLADLVAAMAVETSGA